MGMIPAEAFVNPGMRERFERDQEGDGWQMNELAATVFIYVPTGDPVVDAKNRLLIAEHGYCFPQKIVVGALTRPKPSGN